MQQLDYNVVIIGAGFAGLGAAIRLKKSGEDSFVVFERASEVGGTWRDNTYPGCGCDVASPLYSFSFEPNPNWTRRFSKQPEILQYLKGCVQRNNLDAYIQFNTEIFGIFFHEKEGFYTITDATGKQTTARMVIVGLGPLNRPQIPDFKGLNTFKGKIFHSSNWDYSYDLTGKRVAVIGTGASVIQFVPEIVDKVSKLHLFQRTAPWIIPKFDAEHSDFAKSLFAKIPFFQTAYRELIFWLNEFVGLSFLGNETIGKLVKFQANSHIDKQVKDPTLREVLRPSYRIGCKRILVSNDYYPAIQKPNVQIVTNSIAEIKEHFIIDISGKEIEVDAIIFGTGFHAAEYPEKFIKNYTISGLGGRNLFQEWTQKGFEAFKGTTINGFPNLMFILGPNTGLGHNTVIHIMESQVNYILKYYEILKKLPLKSYLNTKPEVQQKYNERIQSEFKNTAWASGCGSYYMNSEGKNTTIYPRLNTAFRKETAKVNIEDYLIGGE
ncbi:MAG: NAD(P)/FAD-dependent oxidoreductase [Arcicella sp.]|nr:NAD(P)/FAD-dependent oxidoreductase [Arcicella sp.]